MIKIKKMRFIPLLLILLLVGMMVVPTMSMAAPSTPLTVDLGLTSSFAVLAGSTVTNTGSTTIAGDAGVDVGVSAGSAIIVFPPGVLTGVGTFHSNDALAIQAQTDLGNAYVDASTRTITQDLSGLDLGGLTLTPGVYYFSSSAGLTGDLTLDGQGLSDPVFIFQIGSTLTTADGAPGLPASRVLLTNGARYCRTFWQVGSSATLGANSHFVGHIFALASITANHGASVQGQLLARNGAVTLDTNTITNGICATTSPPPASATLHVITHVINDDGRTAVADNFNLHVKTSGSDVALSPAPGVEAPGTSYTLAAGTYAVSEDTMAGYTLSYSGDSDANGNITLAAGANKTVTITNNDIYHSSGGGEGGSPRVNPPLINIIETPEPLALTSGQGSVTYTYKVFNPGMVALSNVSVTDDKVYPVNYISGDINADNLLQSNEIWIYSTTMNLNETTTNTATAKGSANGMTATDIAFATVVVTPLQPPTPKLPKTGSETNVPWLIPLGVFAMGLLLITWPVIKRRLSSPKR